MTNRAVTRKRAFRRTTSRARSRIALAVQSPIERLESRVVLAGQTQLLLPPDVLENAGVVNGMLSVFPAPSSELIVSLTNSHPSRLSVPVTVSIPAGQTSVSVPITILNNGVLDGLAEATISTSASGYDPAQDQINVHDNESADVSISIPATASENGGTVVGTISFSDPATNDIVVELTSSDPGRISVPASVIMPAGQTSVNFNLSPQNNTLIDGAAMVSVQGDVDNWTSGFDAIVVQDDDNHLTLTLPGGTNWEGQTLTNAGTLTIGGTLPTDLVVNLGSLDGSEVSVPASVTILANQTSATFTLTLLNDGLTDGSQVATVNASAIAGLGGAINDSENLTVSDADVHQFTFDTITSPKSAGIPFAVTIRARNIGNQQIAVFAGSPTLSSTGSGASGLPGSVTFTGGAWTGNVTMLQHADDAFLTVNDGAGHVDNSNTFDVLPAATAIPDLVSLSDTGLLNTDNYTNYNNANTNVRMQFTVENTIPGALVIVYANGAGIGSATATGTSTLITSIAFNRLNDATYSITARQTIAGLQSAHSAGLSVTVDTVAPSVPGPVDMDASSDSGAHNFDNYTNDSTPLLHVEAGPYFRVYRNAAQISGNYETGTTYTPTPLANSTHLLSVANVDAAGNVSARSADLFITVDTVAPGIVIAPNLRASSDGGSNNTDNITNVLALSFDVVVVEAYYRVYRDGVQISSDYQLGSIFTTAPQPVGTFNYQVSEVDFAGNVGTKSASLQVQIDPTMLTAPQLTAASDSGASNSDGTTFFNGSVGLPLVFSIPNTLAGATVTVYAGGVPIGSALSGGGTILVSSDGSNPLSDGPHQITVRQQLPAQPASLESDITNITVDTSAPGAVVPDLQAASDTGGDNTDNHTSDNTPTFDIAAPYYSLYRNGLLISSQFATGAFIDGPLGDGTYLYSAVAFDLAGNSAFPVASLSVTIDTTAPEVEGIPQFNYTASPNQLTIRFSENVSASLSAGSIGFVGAAESTIPAAGYSFDPVTNTATFVVPASLANGQYRAIVPAGTVLDGSGLALSADISVDFFILAGDINHDRAVDVRDLVILSANWFQSGKTYSEGDLNYDGVVNSADLSILARNWQQTVAAPAPAPSSAPQPAVASRRTPVRTPQRMVQLVVS